MLKGYGVVTVSQRRSQRVIVGPQLLIVGMRKRSGLNKVPARLQRLQGFVTDK